MSGEKEVKVATEGSYFSPRTRVGGKSPLHALSVFPLKGLVPVCMCVVCCVVCCVLCVVCSITI